MYTIRVKVAPANLRSKPSNQFACVKRLLNIVIGAKPNLCRGISAWTEDNQRYVWICLPYGLASRLRRGRDSVSLKPEEKSAGPTRGKKGA